MSAKIQALRSDAAPPTRSPARQALADAIQRRTDALATVARVEAALGRARALWNGSDDAIAAAKAKRDEALAAEPHRLVDALLADEAPKSDGALRDAEGAVAKAEADARTAEEACRLINGQLAAARTEASRAFDAVRGAVAAALRADPTVAAAIDAFETARRTAADLNSVLYELAGVSGLPAAIAESWQSMIQYPSPSQPAWHAAIERLRDDPDASLPDVAVKRAEPSAA